jgi:hypothetical protein
VAITVIAGTASASNGGVPAPTIPGTPQAGDWMVAFYASREATDGTVSLPAGWDQRVNDRNTGGLVAAWTRPWQSGDAAPTFTVGGHATGSSGDSNQAVIHLVRPTTGMQLQFVGASTPSHNGASSTTVGPIDGDSLTVAANGIVFVLGQHRETWTSVATLSGDGLTWTQATDNSNASGADNALAIDWALSNNVAVTDKSYTITGSGGSSTGSGFMLFLKEIDASAPFKNNDWPNPKPYPRRALPLHMQRKSFAEAEEPAEDMPARWSDWPNPQYPRRAQLLHVQQQQLDERPTNVFDWPNPQYLRRALPLHVQQKQLDEVVAEQLPPSSFDWPNPKHPRRALPFHVQRKAVTGEEAEPEEMPAGRWNEWPNPRHPKRLYGMAEWHNPLTTTLQVVETMPAGRWSDWPNPLRPKRPLPFHVQRKSFGDAEVVASDPFRQNDWPLPGRARRSVELLTWIRTPQDQGGAPEIEWPTPTGPEYYLYGMTEWHNSLLTTLQVAPETQPARTFDWPNPRHPRRLHGLVEWHNPLYTTLQTVEAMPPGRAEWSNPLQLRRLHGLVEWHNPLYTTLQIPPETPPLRSFDYWPNPQHPKRLYGLVEWYNPLYTTLQIVPPEVPPGMSVILAPDFHPGNAPRLGPVSRDPDHDFFLMAKLSNADHYLNDVERWVEEQEAQGYEVEDFNADPFTDTDLFPSKRHPR